MVRDVEKRAIELIGYVLGGEKHVSPSFLNRPGRLICGARWQLVCQIYERLTGRCLPDEMPVRERRRVDCVLKISGRYRIVEIDEEQHFNCHRAMTLEMYPPELPLAFDRHVWRKLSYHDKKLPAGGFARPRPPLFPEEGGRHLQRAFRDALCDIIPLEYDFLPTLRIGKFEILPWMNGMDAIDRMVVLLTEKTS
jgi:hypothetical protein